MAQKKKGSGKARKKSARKKPSVGARSKRGSGSAKRTGKAKKKATKKATKKTAKKTARRKTAPRPAKKAVRKKAVRKKTAGRKTARKARRKKPSASKVKSRAKPATKRPAPKKAAVKPARKAAGKKAAPGRDNAFFEHFRNKLLEQRQQITRRLDELRDELRGLEETPRELEEWAQEEKDRDILIRLEDRETGELRRIQAALGLIDQRQYGYCQICGKPILRARLEELPTAFRCVDCTP
jgi:RNA polymerase-binding protein DksA